jgi:CheY-like chemotaxis protein
MKNTTNSNNMLTSLKGNNILVVEDDEINTYYFLEILQSTGARIIYAKNGQEAVEKVNMLDDINIILMDLKMPVMDGYEAFQKIREIKQHIPVIAQTAYAMENDRKKIMDFGFDGYIKKPIDKQELYGLLNQFLKSNKPNKKKIK